MADGTSRQRDADRRRGWPARLFVGLWVALATALNQSAIHWRPNVADDHLFAWHGWCIGQGARPYLDVWDNKPPGIWWVNAAAFDLAGDGVLAEIVACAPAVALALLALAGVARALFDPSLALVAAVFGGIWLLHPALEFGGNRTETFVVASELAAAGALLHGWRTGRSGWFLGAGLAAGAAPVFKQSGVGFAAAAIVTLCWTALRGRPAERPPRGALVRFAAGLACGPGCAALALAVPGALGEAWHAVVTFNQAYFAVQDATWFRLGAALRVYTPLISQLTGLTVAAAVGVACLVTRPPPGAPAEATARRTRGMLLLLWFAIAAYLACVGPGRRGHHFLPAVPPLVLLACVPLQRLVAPVGVLAAMMRRSGIIIVLLLYAVITGGALSAAVRELDRAWGAKASVFSLDWRAPPAHEAQAAEIRRRSAPDATLYVWGWSPGTYRFAYRRCPSRFATLEKLGQVGEHAAFIRAGAIVDIQRQPPQLFVISPGDLAALPAAQPPFAAWLARHYVQSIDVGGMAILQRRDQPGG